MKIKRIKKELSHEEYYNAHGALKDDEALRKDILSGKRRRRLRNISIKIDPLYLQSIKKIATLKGIPYQTLLRQWLTENIKKELRIA